MSGYTPEARRLLRESKDRERGTFGTKTPRRATLDQTGPDEGEDQMSRADAPGPTDIAEMDFLNPTIDDQLGRPGSSLTGYSITEEITEAELLHTLPHYTTPYGRIVKHPKKRALTEKQHRAEHNAHMQRRQMAMLELRARNDRDMRRD